MFMLYHIDLVVSKMVQAHVYMLVDASYSNFELYLGFHYIYIYINN